MPFIGREELEALRASAEQVNILQRQLDLEREVSTIADNVRDELSELENSHLINDEVRGAAKAIVF